MIDLLLNLFILVIFVFFFIRLRIGLSLYIAYFILIPILSPNFFGYVLKWNMVNLLLLIAFLFKYYTAGRRHNKLDFRPIYPFVILYFFLGIVMVFQDGAPYNYMINEWRADLMINLILPFVVWNTCKIDHKCANCLTYTIIICVIISVLYGLFLTQIPGINPYLMILLPIGGGEFNAAYAAGNSGLATDTTLAEGRLFGRISSVFVHPMAFGLFLGLSLMYVYSVKDKIGKPLFYFLMLIIIVIIMVCGIRTPIAALLISVVSFLILKHQVKLMIQIVGLCLIGYLILLNIPGMESYIGSIFMQNSKSSNLAGSSLAMRIDQLGGCFQEIRDCLLFGKGYSWTTYYLLYKETIHPILLGFESLAFVVLCNWGIYGVLIWSYAFYAQYKYIKYRVMSSDRLILYTLMVYYLSYAMITGEYGYMKYFLLFYSLTLVAVSRTYQSIDN